MKNSILAILAIASLVACKNKETNTVETTDSTTVITPADSGMSSGDSATMQDPNSTAANLSDQDRKFADAAARGGMMEVMMGELASANATNATVKELGKMMVKDHGKANEELKMWASQVGYTLPASLDAEKQKKYDDLKAKKGADFDRMYADLMVTDHQKDIAEFKKQASDGSDASLKSFAGNKVPTLEHHLMESENAKKAVK